MLRKIQIWTQICGLFSDFMFNLLDTCPPSHSNKCELEACWYSLQKTSFSRMLDSKENQAHGIKLSLPSTQRPPCLTPQKKCIFPKGILERVELHSCHRKPSTCPLQYFQENATSCSHINTSCICHDLNTYLKDKLWNSICTWLLKKIKVETHNNIPLKQPHNTERFLTTYQPTINRHKKLKNKF